MKKFMIVLIIGLISLSAIGQESDADKLFDKYSSEKGVTSIVISKYMITMFSNMETDDTDFDEMINVLTGIKMLSGISETSSDDFYKNIRQKLPELGYNELMYVTEDGNQLKFFVHETNKKVDELVLVSVGEKEDGNLFILIQGDINLKTIHRIAKVNGLEKLQNIKEK